MKPTATIESASHSYSETIDVSDDCFRDMSLALLHLDAKLGKVPSDTRWTVSHKFRMEMERQAAKDKNILIKPTDPEELSRVTFREIPIITLDA